MSHAIIASIYETKLIAWSKARAEPIKVVFENVQYDPDDGETYLRAFLLPGDTASSTLAGDTGHSSAFTRSALWPRQAPARPRRTRLWLN